MLSKRASSAGMFGPWRVGLAVGCAVLGLGTTSAAHGQQSAAPIKLRFGGDPAQTRVVLELDQAASAEVISDGAGDGHVVLAFSTLKVGDSLDGQGKGMVRRWRLEQGVGRVRLNLDLARKGKVRRRFLLPPGDGVSVYRYVLDIQAEGADADAPPAPRLLTAASARKPASAPSAAVLAGDPEAPSADIDAVLHKASLGDGALSPGRRRPAKAPAEAPIAKKIIVVDAGHGGHDPGALGGVSHEKDVTLAAAKALKARLERTGRFKVVMTRDSDAYVPLENRVKIARSANADLFISLHADSGGDPKVRGATVYTLSDHGVDRTAKSVFGGGFIDVQLPGRDLSVKQILLDLTQRTTRNRSGAFAETLLEHISTRTELLRRSHRDAGYMVLLAPDVPAVLLEMGFITNPTDEANLNDPDKRARLMDGVAEAIEGYFADNPVKVATAE